MLFGMIAFAVAVLVSAPLSRRALQGLSDAQKVKLVDVAAKRRWIGTLGLLAFVAVYFFAFSAVDERRLALQAMLAFAIVMGVVSILRTRSLLRELGASAEQARPFVLASGVRLTGLGALVAGVFVSIG